MCTYREHNQSVIQFVRDTGLSLCIQGTQIHEKTSVWLCQVYPCVYREHITCCLPFPNLSGLSLCIQGTHQINAYTDITERFIPVCTGNMFHFIADELMETVYPCVYREHSAIYF